MNTGLEMEREYRGHIIGLKMESEYRGRFIGLKMESECIEDVLLGLRWKVNTGLKMESDYRA